MNFRTIGRWKWSADRAIPSLVASEPQISLFAPICGYSTNKTPITMLYFELCWNWRLSSSVWSADIAGAGELTNGEEPSRPMEKWTRERCQEMLPDWLVQEAASSQASVPKTPMSFLELARAPMRARKHPRRLSAIKGGAHWWSEQLMFWRWILFTRISRLVQLFCVDFLSRYDNLTNENFVFSWFDQSDQLFIHCASKIEKLQPEARKSKNAESLTRTENAPGM